MPERTTRVHVWITDYDDNDVEQIKQIMHENNFRIQCSHKPSDNDIKFQSHGFGYTDENLDLVQELKQIFEIEFPSRMVNLEDGTLGDHAAIDYFECIRIRDEHERRSIESDNNPEPHTLRSKGNSSKECPECDGQKLVRTASDDIVCKDCGIVVDEAPAE